MDSVDRHLVYLYMLHTLLRTSTPHASGDPLLARQVPFLYERDAQDIKKVWGWSDEEIDASMVRSCPQPIRWKEVVPATLSTVERTFPLCWHFVIEELRKCFDLFRVPGFYYWEGLWRINIPEDIRFLLPYRDDNNLILGLKLYRSAADSRPQLLNSQGLIYGARAIEP